MYFEIYQEGAGIISKPPGSQWRWRLKSANHETIASGESYHNKMDCIHAINLVKSTTLSTPVKNI